MSETSRSLPSASTFYAEIGGGPTFRALVARFYAGGREDPILRPMSPPDDWAGAETRLRLFLEQYWGGPRTYSENRGHPRLRMRHAPFAVDEAARDAWLRHMTDAVRSAGLPPEVEHEVLAYFDNAATHLINHP